MVMVHDFFRFYGETFFHMSYYCGQHYLFCISDWDYIGGGWTLKKMQCNFYFNLGTHCKK